MYDNGASRSLQITYFMHVPAPDDLTHQFVITGKSMWQSTIEWFSYPFLSQLTYANGALTPAALIQRQYRAWQSAKGTFVTLATFEQLLDRAR